MAVFFTLGGVLERGIDDFSLPSGLITIVLLVGAAIFSSTLFRSTRNSSSIPHVPSWLFFVGSGLEYFGGISVFCSKYQRLLGPTYWATIFGREWLFVNEPEDINKVMRSAEKNVSMYQAIHVLAGSVMPKEPEQYPTPDMEKRISFGNDWTGIPSTPFIAHAVRPPRLQSMVPQIRQMLQENFSKLPKSGTVDLFQWCNDLISAVTVKILLGDHAQNAKTTWQRERKTIIVGIEYRIAL